MRFPEGRLLLTGLVLLAFTALADEPPRTAGPGQVLYIQPMGKKLPDRDVSLVKQALTEFYGLDVGLLPRIDLPLSAYYKPRRRYRAEKLLDFLEKRIPADGFKILGLTAADISTTKGKYVDWGVLGLGTLDGKACVISRFRCRRTARNAKHARIRLAKVAVHEIGHTLGLEHCPTVGCLMEDARGKVKTCDREYDICASCRARLSGWGRPIAASPEIPWPRP